MALQPTWTVLFPGHFGLAAVDECPKKEVSEAIGMWVRVYLIVIPMQLAQALGALEGLAEQIDYPRGLQGREMLAERMNDDQTEHWA